MRVDEELLRAMLEGVEQAPGPEAMNMPEPPGYSAEVRRWHTQLLVDGGYVTAQQLRPYRPAFAVGLTVAGQRLLDELRDRGRRAGADLARAAGQVVERVATGAAVAVLMAKARALGIDVAG